MKICANCSEIKDEIAVKQEITGAGEPDDKELEDDFGSDHFLEQSFDDLDCSPLSEEEKGIGDDDFEWDIKQGWLH